ncbi:MAG: class I SAM-dependent methyltransferase, partial [Acidimicrobiales bacterium]
MTTSSNAPERSDRDADLTAPLPLGDAKRLAVRAMFDAIAPRYDIVNKLMTFGLDVRWRKRTISLLDLPARSLVVDVACGTGDLARLLRSRAHDAVAVDLSAGMLDHARAGGAPLVLSDAALLPIRTSSVDGAVSGFALRNFADLATTFS